MLRKQAARFRDAHWFAMEPALALLAAQLTQPRINIGVLNALCRNGQVEAVTQARDRVDDGGAVAACEDREDEALVDLDAIKGEGAQVRQ